MSKENGGPAFPIHGGWGTDPKHQILGGGATLRDYFAAKAMSGMIARTNWGVEDDALDIAYEAYGYADAMLKAREE